MPTKNIVFIAQSLDGYIADNNDQIDWLEMIPNPEHDDMGYNALMDEIDAIVMGRNSFETVLGFGIDWPYQKPVFVLSNTIQKVPEKLKGKVFLLNGTLTEILEKIHNRGFSNLYIDGGKTIQNFLAVDLINELRITTLPILLGGGIPLFGLLPNRMEFRLIKSKVYLDHLVQSHYIRHRNTDS